MKTIYFLILPLVTCYLTSCSSTPTDKAQSAVKSYLKDNLKNESSYEPISFSNLDTLERGDTSETQQISLYEISHIYSIANSDNEKVKMTIAFYLDKDLKVIKTNTKSINGEYGSLTGNAYWKYNDYVGNKPDAGTEIELYSLDTVRQNLKFDASADVQGNYSIEKVLPGSYILIVRSKNATDCPEYHLKNLEIHKSYIKQLFGFDLDNYNKQLDELDSLDSLHSKSIYDFPTKGSLSQMRASQDKTNALKSQMRDKAAELIASFPDDFKSKIKLYHGYSNACDFSIIRIEEGKTEHINTDFGITCI